MEENRVKDNFSLENLDDKEIDLNSFLNSFRRNRRTIFFTTFIGTVLGIIYTLIQNPVYLGRFQIVVETKEEQKSGLRDPSLRNILAGKDTSSLKAQELILKSPSVLKPVYKFALTEYKSRNDYKKNWSFNTWRANTLDIKFAFGTNVLNIGFKDKDTKFILSTLEKIIYEYQNYSKLSRDKNLRKGFDFLTSQQKVLKEKALISSKEFNKFSIKNGLGDIDGFVKLGPSNRLSTNKIIQDYILENNLQTISDTDEKAGQRFDKQFKLLEKYEAEYIDYSSILKSNSELLTNLKLKIDNLKESLKRPNEILLKFKELRKVAQRDEIILNQVQDDLAFTKLELAKQRDPWDMIFEPTIDDARISPRRTKTTILSFIISLTFGGLLAYFKDKFSSNIYELNELRGLIKCGLIDSIELETKDISKKIIYKYLESETKENLKTALSKTYFVDTFSNGNNVGKTPLNILFENEKNILISLKDTNEIESAEYLIIFINKNNIKKEDVSLVNKYISLYPSKVLGWYFLEDK